MKDLYLINLHVQYRKNENKYRDARRVLLILFIVTALNIFLLLVTNTDTYFIISAFIPYFVAYCGKLFCGLFSKDYYTDELSDITFIDNYFFYIFLFISISLTLLYLLAWVLSAKKRVGWLIFAFTFFTVDTLAVFIINGISIYSSYELIAHAVMIYVLIRGIIGHYKLQDLPQKEEAESVYDDPDLTNDGSVCENSEPETISIFDSDIIRKADDKIKHRVFLKVEVLNLNICYRRVKHTNELVINGNVYDEIKGMIEFKHCLCAWVNGHYITAGYKNSLNFICIDGVEVAGNARIW